MIPLRSAWAAACLAAIAVALPSAAQNLKMTPQQLAAELQGDTYPVPIRAAAPETRIPGRYIVLFKQGVESAPAQAKSVVALGHGKLHYAYDAAVSGFAATLDEGAVQAL